MPKSDMKTKLVNLLNVLFQFEDQDLDFGIYRIMNQKRESIRKFIDQELVTKIQQQLKMIAEEDKKRKLLELEELRRRCIEAYDGDAFENGELKGEYKKTGLGKKYTDKLEEMKKIEDTEDLERDIYNHIFSFFSRYYDRGDFVSKRRVGRKEKYAMPYSGEETLLHWANKDQYYVKSILHFRIYTFKVGDLTVNFRVVRAEEEKGSVKAETRYFVIHEENPFELKGNVLNVYFEYRPLEEKEVEGRKFGKKAKIGQKDVNHYNSNFLQHKLGKKKKVKALFKKENERAPLDKNLHKYTMSNKSDFFVHKNLRAFLLTELDFYIKNEVLNLEDIKRLDKEDLDGYLLEAKIIHNISLIIIEFLSQIEKLQRKLWEKKKFVVKTDYVITLDKIREFGGQEFLKSILNKIAKNEGQTIEWKELLDVEVKNSRDLLRYDTLPIDTSYFDEEFKLKLLEAITNEKTLDSLIDGISIRSDNFHALNLLSRKYYEQMMCVYIDPPYNTGSDEFLFKDDYQHSSWVSMMSDRLKLARKLLSNKGSIFINCDDNEMARLGLLMGSIFGEENFVATIVWEKVHTRKNSAKYFSVSHDYIPCFTASSVNPSCRYK